MTGACCRGSASSRLARRVSKAAASILPGTALILLPKCPLCLAAWLTVVTGFGFSATGAVWVRATLMAFSVAAVALAAAPIVRRRKHGHGEGDGSAAPPNGHRMTTFANPALPAES